MEKAKKIALWLYMVLIGAIVGGMIQNSNWFTRYKGILVEIQTAVPGKPAHLLWRAWATIITLGVMGWGITSLKKKFNWKALIAIILSVAWLLFAFIAILATMSRMMGGNPETLVQIVQVIAKAVY